MILTLHHSRGPYRKLHQDNNSQHLFMSTDTTIKYEKGKKEIAHQYRTIKKYIAISNRFAVLGSVSYHTAVLSLIVTGCQSTRCFAFKKIQSFIRYFFFMSYILKTGTIRRFYILVMYFFLLLLKNLLPGAVKDRYGCPELKVRMEDVTKWQDTIAHMTWESSDSLSSKNNIFLSWLLLFLLIPDSMTL